MKAYKYYVHGKPKTFDLTTLTDDEIEKFKNMDNTERLRFIELHHLENKPLWDTVDIKTSTKLTDEGLTNEKNYKKYYDLYKNQNIKNKLEQMKENGKTGEVNEKDLKEVFSDEDYKDINDKVKKGYKDYDSLINYYANKIETLNVDSIDTLKAKEIQNLEAKNISRINISGLNKLVDDYTTVKEGTDEDKEEISKSKELVDKLKEETKKVFPTITKEEIKEIIKDNDLLNAFIEELNEKIKIANKVNDNKEVLKALEDLKNKTISKDEFTKILKDNIKDEEMVKQILSDVGVLKGMLEDVKKDNEEFKGTIINVNKAIDEVNNKLKDMDKKGLSYDDMLKTILIPLDDFIDNYGYNEKTKVRIYTKYKDNTKIDFPPYKTEEAIDSQDKQFENIMKNLDKYITIIKNYDNLPVPSGDTNRINQTVREGNKFIKYAYNVLSKFDEFNNYGKGEECGKFLNRFKDFEPEIKRVEEVNKKQEDKINTLINEVKELKEMMKNKVIKEEIKTEPKDEESKPVKPNEPFRFLNDISKPKNLKPTETKIYKPEDFEDSEHKDLKDILRRRREDIEPDETEEEDDEDWGEGIKHSKVIKFKELLKLLK